MDKLKYQLLSDGETIAILTGFMVGVGFLALPNEVAMVSKNDSCISTIIGGGYPLFFSLLAIYFCRKHPNEDILTLSKRFLGNVMGTICNIVFMAQFLLHIAVTANGYKNVLTTYATPFLTSMRVLIIIISIAAYVNFLGIKALARINIISLLLTLIITFILAMALLRGRYLNLLPVVGTSVTNIVKGSLESAYAYSGMEGILLIYPLIKNKDKIASISLKASGIVIFIYSWVVFMTIYYLGYKVTTKTLWPVLLVTESANLPFINSFRLVFILLWSINVLKLLSNEYYASIYIVQDTLKVKKSKGRNMAIIALMPILIYSALKVGDEVQRRVIIDNYIPKAILYNIIYGSVIAVLAFINDMRKRKV